MGLIELIVYIAILGLIVWAVTTLIPMPAPFKTVIYVIAGIFCLLLLLRVLGGVNLPHLG
jgi:hypothetical protein